jgi:hypothetical protein
MGKTDVDDPQYLNKRLSNLARREGAAFSSLVDLFLSYAEKTGRCLHGFENSLPCGGHWNSEGHRLAGEEIASVICGQLSEQADLDVPSSPSIWRGSELQTLDR